MPHNYRNSPQNLTPIVIFLLGVFSLNNQTGVLSPSSSLDYETTTQYVLNMSASDLGNPTRRTFIDVTVNVMDVNDNSPVLNSRTVQVSLSEVRKITIFDS